MSKQSKSEGSIDAPPGVPGARRRPHSLSRHGHTRIDEYYWLRHRDDAEVIDYLNAENNYSERVLGSFGNLKNTLLAEMKSRIPDNESSVPYRDGRYFYYHRYEKGREYPVYCRKTESLSGQEEVLLDVNKLAVGHDYFSLSNFSVSPDHRRAAYAVDTEGRRFYTLHFLEFGEPESTFDPIVDITDNFEWANDSRTIVYVRQDRDTLRDFQVFRHVPGEHNDVLVYEEDDNRNWLGVERSLSGKFLFLVSSATLSTEVRYLSADRPSDEPRLFHAREPEHEYYVTDGEDRFYILSNDHARNFRVMETALDKTGSHNWQEYVAHRDDVLIDSMEVFADHVVLSTVAGGQDHIEVINRGSRESFPIAFDEAVYTVYPNDNHRYHTDELRYVYESLTTPESCFDFNLLAQEATLIREQEVPGGFRRENYRAERLMVSARDGARVPVSLVYRNGMTRDGSQPLLVYGYGSYGISIEPDFDSDIFSLLDRGFIYAIAHVRGGSEMGRQWYYDGRQHNKMNTFNDFIDVTRHLIAAGYTSSQHCYASGGSAGGLLMGAIANMAPELYRGIATRVPFVDVVTTMLDDSIPLTTGEFDEWGNPSEHSDYEYMLTYSPYDNVTPQEYPNLLVTTGLHDSQVQYWEPAKWVARLRASKTDQNLVLLWTDMAAGHSGKTGRFRSLEDTALVYSFFLMLEG